VSALSAAVVFRHRAIDTWAFLRRRFIKLTIPPWTFLTIFFGIAFAYSASRGKPFPFSRDDVINSYALRSGVGYVWIFRVYLVIALLTPCLLWAKARLEQRKTCFQLLAVAYVVYELLAAALRLGVQDPVIVDLLDETVLTLLPYAILFAYGLMLGEMDTGAVAATALVSMLVFAGMAMAKRFTAGHFVATQAYKYPPTLYYLSYAFAWINMLVLLARSRLLARVPTRPLTWLSSHVLWIYLWHILGIFMWDMLLGSPAGRLLPAMAKLVFVVGFGIAATWCQQCALARLVPHTAGARRPFVRTIFG